MKATIAVQYSITFVFITFLLLFQNANATHIAGSEMFYRWSQDSTYEVTIIFNRNCNGLIPAPPINLVLRSKSSSISQDYNTNLRRLPSTGNGVPPLRPPNMYNCLFNDTGFCIEEYVYRGNWTSKGRANDWILSTTMCCRPGPGGNMRITPINIIPAYSWIQCGLNNLDFPDLQAKNSSPFWHNRRPNHPGFTTDTLINYFIKTMCTGTFYSLDQSVTEYQGDSISYSFFWPQGTSGINVKYISPYSFTYPLPTINGLLRINPQTGIIPIVPGSPQGKGVYIIGIEAKEWRNDTLVIGGNQVIISKQIGFNRRDLIIIIEDSSVCGRDSAHPKDIYLDTINVDKKLKVHFQNDGQSTLIRCNTISPDGSEFRIVDSANYIHPFDSTLRYIGVTKAEWICQAGLTDEIELTLSEPITCGDYSLILKKGTDLDVFQSECGFWEMEYSSASIFTDTMRPLDLGKNLIVCKRKPFTIELNAGPDYASYYWDTWDTTQSINVSYAREYWVRVTNNFNCMLTDTIEIKEKDCDPTLLQNFPSNGIVKVGDDIINNIDDFEKSSIRIYPNPSSGRVNVQLSGVYKNEEIRIYNLTGKRLASQPILKESDLIELNLEDFKSGVYFIQIWDEGKIIQTERLVLNKN